METYASRGGLVELGVCRKKLPRAQLLQPLSMPDASAALSELAQGLQRWPARRHMHIRDEFEP